MSEQPPYLTEFDTRMRKIDRKVFSTLGFVAGYITATIATIVTHVILALNGIPLW